MKCPNCATTDENNKALQSWERVEFVRIRQDALVERDPPWGRTDEATLHICPKCGAVFCAEYWVHNQ